MQNKLQQLSLIIICFNISYLVDFPYKVLMHHSLSYIQKYTGIFTIQIQREINTENRIRICKGLIYIMDLHYHSSSFLTKEGTRNEA